MLHQALSVAFGWANTHLYDFDILDSTDDRGRENRLSGPQTIFKITDLSTVEEEFGFEAPNRDSSKVALFKVLDDPKTKGKTIHYNYDFGDGWEHVITYTGRTDATAYFVCIDGEGHGAAEDVGGHVGWKELLEAYDAPNPTRDQNRQIKWFETSASNNDAGGLRGEKKWRWDKDGINTVLRELGQPFGNAPASSNSLLSVLLISLDKQPFFDEMYAEVLPKLRSKAAVTEVTHIASAMQHLSKPQDTYTSIILTDAAVMEDKFIAAQEKLVYYARAGGDVILGFHFSSFSIPSKMNSFFKDRWGLNWKSGKYQRSMFSLNPRATAMFMSRPHDGEHPSLLQQYSMKALHLSNTKLEDRIYVSNDSGSESPAVFAKYGNGHLGWIGDVNTEIGTTELLLAMCDV
jgi:hypothetical protein